MTQQTGKIIYSIDEDKSPDLKKYEDWGIDISLLISSLNQTPTERLKTNNELLRFMDEVQKIRSKKDL